MELEISYDDDGNEYLDRLSFTKTIVESLKDYLDGDKIIVRDIKSNHIIIDTDEGQVEVGLTDDTVDLELKLIVYVLISAQFYATPKIVFHITEDRLENFILSGFSLSDFSGIMVTTSTEEFDYSVVLGARYLCNLFKMNGIYSLKYLKESKPSKLPMIPSSNGPSIDPDQDDDPYEYEEGDEELEFVDPYEIYEKSESRDATIPQVTRPKGSVRPPTVASVVKNQRQRKLYKKRIRLLRRKDPAAHRRRKRAAKMRWRQNRAKYIQGMRRFHRSTRGKRINAAKGQMLSLKHDMNNDK